MDDLLNPNVKFGARNYVDTASRFAPDFCFLATRAALDAHLEGELKKGHYMQVGVVYRFEHEDEDLTAFAQFRRHITTVREALFHVAGVREQEIKGREALVREIDRNLRHIVHNHDNLPERFVNDQMLPLVLCGIYLLTYSRGTWWQQLEVSYSNADKNFQDVMLRMPVNFNLPCRTLETRF